MFAYLVNVMLGISIILNLLGILYIWAKRRQTYWEKRGVRSVKTHWFFGSTKDAILRRVSPSILLGQLYQQGSKKDRMLGFYILQKPYLLLRCPELIKQILIKDFLVFADRPLANTDNKSALNSKHLISLGNPEWKYLRSKMTPMFSSRKLKNLLHLVVESAEAMGNYLHEQFSDGKEIKTIIIMDVFRKYTTDVISTLAFGVKTNSFEQPPPEFYRKSIEAFQITFWRAIKFFCTFFFPDIGGFLGDSPLGDTADYFRKVFWDSMDTRESTKTKRGDLIDFLLELKNDNEDSTFRFEGDALLAQSIVFFLGGRQASTTVMCFALVELAKHPEIQEHTRQEIREKLKPNGITYEAIQEMKYLHQVISETLRLYPPSPYINRVALKDYQIPGTDIVIEKGTPVYVVLTGLHNDPKFHPDPTCFDPDRFSEERKNAIVSYSYMPFGEGPRMCIGMRLGTLQTAVGLITILRNYEVFLHPLSKPEINPRSVFLTPMPDLKLCFKKLPTCS